MANIKLGDDVYVGVTSIKMNTEDGDVAVFNLAPLSVWELQRRYEFSYYSTMNKAVTDVNNGTTANADAEKGTAVAGVYTDENGGKNVVLLKDHTQNGRITISTDMTINLGGHTLTIGNDYYGIIGATGHSNTVTIDGRLAGSAYVMNGNDGGGVAILPNTNTFVLNGGSYKLNESVANASYYAVVVQTAAGGTVIASDCEMSVNAVSNSIAVYNFGSANVSNCKVIASSKEKNAVGLYNYNGNATFSRCVIKAYADYTYSDSGYAESSQGIQNYGTLTMNDCYVVGTHCGVSANSGELYINGGTYEGYGHGGFYFCGAGTTSYVRDAIIRDCEMPDGYTATANRNGAGMYISGNTTNQTIYMDNCDISGSSASQTIAYASTQNSNVYISNSEIKKLDGGMGHIRIDNATNRLYIGAGNNFTAENTSLPEAVVVTDEVYRSAA